MISCKIVFQLIGNNFQRKLKLIATPYILQWYYNIRLVFETVFFSELVADDIFGFLSEIFNHTVSLSKHSG